MKKCILLLGLLWSVQLMAQTTEEAAIKQVLANQTEAWNKGNIEAFMQTYWKSDSLMFVGKNGVQRGWQNTLENYKKNYPDVSAMGQLSFDIITVKPLSPQYAYVVGKWMVQRSIGNISGHFDLLLQKIKDQWVIIADHSS
jgi:uncharacterized protein (TIGR02246 family)